MFESIELLKDTSCACPFEMNSISKTLPLILSPRVSSLRWQTYFSASELKKAGLAPNADVFGVRARLWKRSGTSDCTIRFGMAKVAGDLETFQELVNVRQMGTMSGVSVGDKFARALPVTRLGETVESFRRRLRHAFWPESKDSDIVVESPSGDEMKDLHVLPASAARRTTVLADGIRNLEWIVRVIADLDSLEKDTSRIRVRLQDDTTSSLGESALVPSLNVSELVLFEETGDENHEQCKLTWDGKSGLVLEICIEGSMNGVSEGGVYVKRHPKHSVRSVYVADGIKGT